MTALEGGLLVVAVAAALVLGLLWRSAQARFSSLASDHEALLGEREEWTARFARESKARKKQAEELAILRKRADKAKKRSARAEKGATDRPLGTSARIADLESQIERIERERDRSRAEREQLLAQVSQLEARLEVASRPKPAALVPTPSPNPTAVPEASVLESQLAEAREQARKAAEALATAKETELRMRKRMSNQEQLYASVRAELEVKKDRLRAQEEQIQRLQAMKVVVSD